MNKLIPHIYFNGNCLEAINHYLHVFKGEIESLDKYKDQPIEIEKELENKIYFSHIIFDQIEFYASDNLNEKITNSTFWLYFDDLDEMKLIAQKLSKDPKLTIEKSVFGEAVLKFADPYGIHWIFVRK